MWVEKKLVVEIDEKDVDKKKQQMLMYRIGEAYILQRKVKQKCLTFTEKKILPEEK